MICCSDSGRTNSSSKAIFQVINFITVTQTNSVIHGQSVSLTSVFVRAGIMEMENIAVKVDIGPAINTSTERTMDAYHHTPCA